MPVRKLRKQMRSLIGSRKKLTERDAERICMDILADNFVSRGERRFIKELLIRKICDRGAVGKFASVLSQQSA
jgi:hypothetical protein